MEKNPPLFGLKALHRPYECTVCGHEQEIETNHTDSCLDYCKGCSWEPSFGEGYAVPVLGDRIYRVFVCTE